MFEQKEIVTVPYKDNHFKIEPFGEYGFLKVRLERGETPLELKDQSFTTLMVAQTAVGNYITKNTQDIKKKV